MQKIQKSLIIGHGPVRDKMELIKMAAAQAKKMFRVLGNVDVIYVSSYEPEINGYIIVVEFEESKDREVVAVQSPGQY